MYVCLEGLPAAGTREILALLRLFFPNHVRALPGLGQEGVEREAWDPWGDRSRVAQALLSSLSARQAQIRAALAEGITVLEDSHLGVLAAYAAAVGDADTLALFHALEEDILWPERFLRLEVPLEVSLRRQEAQAGPRVSPPKEVLSRMAGWLAAWHARRGDRVEVIDADRSPQEVVGAVLARLDLPYVPGPPSEVLPYLLLLGRPAAGKSELLQFLEQIPLSERASAYHLGTLRVYDDFPLLWAKFVEDDLWEEVGRGRLCSRRIAENYAVADEHLWDFLLLALARDLERSPARPGETVVVEFSRGGRDAYRRALSLLPRAVLAQGAILYLEVSPEESRRRNRARYDRARRSEILTHAVPEAEMAKTYATDDWLDLAPSGFGYLSLRGLSVPYGTVVNEPEPRSFGDFARRFRAPLEELWRRWKSR